MGRVMVIDQVSHDTHIQIPSTIIAMTTKPNTVYTHDPLSTVSVHLT